MHSGLQYIINSSHEKRLQNAQQILSNYGLTNQTNNKQQYAFIDYINLQNNNKLTKFSIYKELIKKIIQFNEIIEKGLINDMPNALFQHGLYSNLSNRLRTLIFIKEDQKVKNQLENIRNWFFVNKQKQRGFHLKAINIMPVVKKQQIDQKDNIKMYEMGYRSCYSNLKPPKDRLKQYKIKQLIVENKQQIVSQQEPLNRNLYPYESPKKKQKLSSALRETSVPQTITETALKSNEQEEKKQNEIVQFGGVNSEDQGIQEGQKQQQVGPQKNQLLVNQNKKLYASANKQKQNEKFVDVNNKLIERMENKIILTNFNKQYRNIEEGNEFMKEKIKWAKQNSNLKKHNLKTIQLGYKANKYPSIEYLPKRSSSVAFRQYPTNYLVSHKKYKDNNNQQQDQCNSIKNTDKKQDQLQFKWNIWSQNKNNIENQIQYEKKSILRSASIGVDLNKAKVLEQKKKFIQKANILPNIVNQKKELHFLDNAKQFDERMNSVSLQKVIHTFGRNIKHDFPQKKQMQQSATGKEQFMKSMTAWATKTSSKFSEILVKYQPKHYNQHLQEQIKQFKSKLATKKLIIQEKKLYNCQKIVDTAINNKIIGAKAGDQLFANSDVLKTLYESKRKRR